MRDGDAVVFEDATWKIVEDRRGLWWIVAEDEGGNETHYAINSPMRLCESLVKHHKYPRNSQAGPKSSFARSG